MKKRGPKAYSEEFRREAIRLTESRLITQVARELGVHSETLRGWRRVARARGDMTEPAGGVARSRRLRKRIAGCGARMHGSSRNGRS